MPEWEESKSSRAEKKEHSQGPRTDRELVPTVEKGQEDGGKGGAMPIKKTL